MLINKYNRILLIRLIKLNFTTLVFETFEYSNCWPVWHLMYACELFTNVFFIEVFVKNITSIHFVSDTSNESSQRNLSIINIINYIYRRKKLPFDSAWMYSRRRKKKHIEMYIMCEPFSSCKWSMYYVYSLLMFVSKLFSILLNQ